MHKNNLKIIVNKIEWERVYLTFVIDTNIKENLDFVLLKNGTNTSIPVKTIKNNNNYKICINITNIYNRNFLSNGKWKLGAYLNGIFYPCLVTSSVAYKMDDLSRIFRYGGNNYAYTINFEITENKNNDLQLIINSMFLMKNKNHKKERIFLESKNLKSFFKKTRKKIAIIIMNLYYFLLIHTVKPFYRKGNRVLLMSETKTFLWGNLKALDERIKEKKLDDEFKISYSFRDTAAKHQSNLSWLKLIFLISIQDYIFTDDYAPLFSFLKLDKRVQFIQVWHAGLGFKAVGYCRFGKQGSPHPSKSGYRQLTKAVACSSDYAHALSEVFGIDEGDFIITGMPRLDNFFDNTRMNNFKKEFYKNNPELKTKKIILFAPTYRGENQKKANYDYEKLDFKQLYDFCGSEYVILFKMHPFIKEKVPIEEEFQDRLIDFSEYDNINDLYYITDLLITDYSSNFYEFSLFRKPMIFYTYDRNAYEITRGVHRSVKDYAPGKVCDSFDELIKALKKEDYEFDKVEKYIKKSFDFIDNNACDRVIDNILLK